MIMAITDMEKVKAEEHPYLIINLKLNKNFLIIDKVDIEKDLDPTVEIGKKISKTLIEIVVIIEEIIELEIIIKIISEVDTIELTINEVELMKRINGIMIEKEVGQIPRLLEDMKRDLMIDNLNINMRMNKKKGMITDFPRIMLSHCNLNNPIIMIINKFNTKKRLISKKKPKKNLHMKKWEVEVLEMHGECLCVCIKLYLKSFIFT